MVKARCINVAKKDKSKLEILPEYDENAGGVPEPPPLSVEWYNMQTCKDIPRRVFEEVSSPTDLLYL